MNYESPRKYWEERDPHGKKVEEEKLIGIIVDFIGKHNVMGLATACGEIVRNTPVEYDYWKDAFWFLSEGGRKFDGLEVNKHVCLAIFDQMEKGVCRGLQVTGIAHVLQPEDAEYAEYFAYKKLSPDTFSKRVPYPIPLIKVEVKEFDYFDWALAKEKYHMRQHLER